MHIHFLRKHTVILKNIYKLYQGNLKAKQSVLLFSVNLISIPLGIVTSVFLTRYLGEKDYGNFMFITNIFNLSVIIGTFGFLYAGTRAIVLTHKPQISREYYGALLLISFGLFLLISIGLLFYSLFDNNLRDKNINTLLMYLIPFGWVFLLVRYFESLFQADNKIKLLALSRLYPKLAFFALISVAYYFLGKQNGKLSLVWIMYITSQVVIFLYIIYEINPSFSNIKVRLLQVWKYNKIYGFNVYVGSVFAVGFSQLTGILISYFNLSNVQVGYYALALTFATPLSLVPNIISTTNYKEFSIQKSIPRKIIIITIFLSMLGLVFLWLIVPFIIPLLYGKQYQPVVAINFILSLGVTLYAFADFINRFLSAHGQGKALRNCSFIVGFSLLACNLSLIPIWGATGAAYSMVITGIVYLLSILWFYKILIIKLNQIK